MNAHLLFGYGIGVTLATVLAQITRGASFWPGIVTGLVLAGLGVGMLFKEAAK